MVTRLPIAAGFAFALICGLAQVGQSAQTMPAYPTYSWLFDEGAGATVGAYTGGQEGVLGTTTTWETGVETPFSYAGNGALIFDGSSSAVVDIAGMVSQLDGSDALTISAWVRADAVENRGIFRGDASASDANLQIRYDVDGYFGGGTNVIKAGLKATGGSGQIETSNASAIAGSWQHVVMTWAGDGTGARVYINGTLDTATYNSMPTIGTITGQDGFQLGAGGDSDEYWLGRMDEVAVWKQALTADEVAWLSSNSLSQISDTYYPTVAVANPILHWKLNEASGATAIDATGNGRDGAQVGSGITVNQDGFVQEGGNKAYQFAGDGSYVEDADAGTYLNGLEAVSVELWFKAAQTDIDRSIFSGAASGGDGDFGMRYDEQGNSSGRDQLLKFAVSTTGGSQTAESSGMLQSDEWQHIVLTWESGEDMRLFVDGVEDTGLFFINSAVSGTLSVDTLRLGEHPHSSPSWDGLIDEFLIYDRILSAEEIYRHHLAAIPEPSTLVMLFGLGGIGLLGGLRRCSRS